jgi:hypothetical protein
MTGEAQARLGLGACILLPLCLLSRQPGVWVVAVE